MGAWGVGHFENDTAADWVAGLEDADAGDVRACLREVAGAGGRTYLDADPCSEALAAAEVVAAGLGAPAGGLPEGVVTWLEAHPGAFTSADGALALAAVERIGASSELQELFDEDGTNAGWHAALDALARRLRAGGA